MFVHNQREKELVLVQELELLQEVMEEMFQVFAKVKMQKDQNQLKILPFNCIFFSVKLIIDAMRYGNAKFL